MFVDGTLVPNTEFGQMEIRGRPAERRSASAARARRGLSWKAWAQDLDEHLQRIDDLMWPTLFILGGGVSKNADKFVPELTTRTPVVPAAAAQRRRDHRRGGRGGRGLRRRPSHLGRPARRPCARGRAAGRSRPSRRAYHRGPFPRLPPELEVPIHDHRIQARGRSRGRARPSPGWSSAAKSVDAADGQTFDIVNPATGQTIATAPLGGRADVDRAVEAAQAAFDERKGWANWAAGKRGRSLSKLADLIKKNSDELAWLESRNGGKPITASRGEVIGASLVFDYYAGAANKIFGQTIPVVEARAST